MRHFIEPGSFSLAEQLALLDLADRMEADPAPYAHLCDGRILATLFYEPSTRTRLSFESAMLRLGGKTLGFAGAQLSSASKGETVADTARVVSNYADVIAMRHPKEGAPLRASMYARVPVINAGDGGHAHPSQTMIDLMTIRQRKGRLDHLTIGFCGDLKFGRTVHSLTAALSQFEGNRFVFISPEELRIPQYVKDETLTPLHQNYKETADLEAELPGLDVLYMTRIQQERFFNEEDYLRLKGCYELDEKLLQAAPPTMPVLHPLPRIDEIKPDVDNDPRAAYFDQVHNGVYIRMAIILALLGIPDPLTGEKGTGKYISCEQGCCTKPRAAALFLRLSPLRPSREKAILENPQIFQNCEIINNSSAEDGQSARGGHFKSSPLAPKHPGAI